MKISRHNRLVFFEPPRHWYPCRLMKTLVLAVLLLAACGPKGDRPLQGYIEGEYVRVAAPFAGTLQQLSVQRGDEIKSGAAVFALERENEVAARHQAEQQV